MICTVEPSGSFASGGRTTTSFLTVPLKLTPNTYPRLAPEASVPPRWAGNENDDIQNGLALFKNAHWIFGEGLWSVQADGRVILARYRLAENGQEAVSVVAAPWALARGACAGPLVWCENGSLSEAVTGHLVI